MDLWVLWTIIAVALGVGEVLTSGLYLAPFALGAVAAGIVSGAGGSDFISWLMFVLGSGALFFAFRPMARRLRRQGPVTRTNTAALIGKTAVVLERIANHEAVGVVRIDGEVWTARSYDEDVEIEPGARVQVLEIRGATALVSE